MVYIIVAIVWSLVGVWCWHKFTTSLNVKQVPFWAPFVAVPAWPVLVVYWLVILGIMRRLDEEGGLW